MASYSIRVLNKRLSPVQKLRHEPTAVPVGYSRPETMNEMILKILKTSGQMTQEQYLAALGVSYDGDDTEEGFYDDDFNTNPFGISEGNRDPLRESAFQSEPTDVSASGNESKSGSTTGNQSQVSARNGGTGSNARTNQNETQAGIPETNVSESVPNPTGNNTQGESTPAQP